MAVLSAPKYFAEACFITSCSELRDKGSVVVVVVGMDSAPLVNLVGLGRRMEII
jgi:hypothetical protein